MMFLGSETNPLVCFIYSVPTYTVLIKHYWIEKGAKNIPLKKKNKKTQTVVGALIDPLLVK